MGQSLKEALLLSLELEMADHYLLQFFSYDHLPPTLRGTSAPFSELAQTIIRTLPNNPERTTALRKLLEAKDCAVRALIFRDEP